MYQTGLNTNQIIGLSRNEEGSVDLSPTDQRIGSFFLFTHSELPMAALSSNPFLTGVLSAPSPGNLTTDNHVRRYSAMVYTTAVKDFNYSKNSSCIQYEVGRRYPDATAAMAVPGPDVRGHCGAYPTMPTMAEEFAVIARKYVGFNYDFKTSSFAGLERLDRALGCCSLYADFTLEQLAAGKRVIVSTL